MSDSGCIHSATIFNKVADIEKAFAVTDERLANHIKSYERAFENIQEALKDLSETMKTLELREASVMGLTLHRETGLSKLLSEPVVKYSSAGSIIFLTVATLVKWILGVDIGQ